MKNKTIKLANQILDWAYKIAQIILIAKSLGLI
jgi:hypothetical protein